MKMRNSLLLMVLTAMTLTLASCSKDDDNDNGKPNDTHAQTIPAPPYKDDAVKLSLPDNNISVGGLRANVTALELGEGGTYIVTYTLVATTRAADGTSYKTGKYTKSNDSYNLSGFATVTINGKSGSTYTIVVKTTDGVSTELNATAATGGVATGAMTDNLCRTWTIENTRLTMEVEGITAGRDFPGTCNLNALIAYAKDRGMKINDEVEENSVVTGITFSRAGTFLINYMNGKNDVGKWNWASQASGTISYGWNDPDMGNSLENGEATVAFDGSKCKLTLGATIDGHKLQAIYTLSF